MATTEKTLRASIIAHGARIVEIGLGGAPDGDISARVSDSILITPSGARYSALRPAMITQMPLGGELWRLERSDEAIGRMASSPRHRPSQAGYRSHCPHPVALRHRARDGA